MRKKIAARFREDRKKLARCASYKAISLLVLVYWSLKFTQNQKKHEETNRNPAHPKAGTWLSYPSTVARKNPHLEPGSINPSILRGSVFRGWKNLCTFECFHQSWHSKLGTEGVWTLLLGAEGSCWGGRHKITEKKKWELFLSMFYQIKKMRKWAPFPSKTPQISATRVFFLADSCGRWHG